MYLNVPSPGGIFLGRVRRYGIVEGGVVLGIGVEVSKDSPHSQDVLSACCFQSKCKLYALSHSTIGTSYL